MTELLVRVPSIPYQFSMACKMWFGFQFNLSDSSDDGLYRLDLDPEGQGHQWKMISIQLGSYFGAPKKNRAGGYRYKGKSGYLPYFYIKSAVEKKKFK